uniref:Regulatory protein zeste n=1 Tax=Timema cristinae TaxID=61476 RepID=A0A7R9DR16_TIMCR|nr:unnamed protein product [Timema cristinae]
MQHRILNKKEAWKNIAKEYNSNYNVSKRDKTQLKRCWEKFKSQLRKQKQLERQHSMKTERGEPYKTSPADDKLAAQVLTFQSWLDEEIVTPWDSDARYLQYAALVHTINHPETHLHINHEQPSVH